MTNANVVHLQAGPRWRALIAHQRADVRHVLRTLIEASDVAVIEAFDGDSALSCLETMRFDLLVLELDLPVRDGVTLVQLHRVLLAHEHAAVEPPDVILTLPPEVRDNRTLTEHLRSLGVAAVIDDSPRADAAAVIDLTLQTRAERLAQKPAVA